MLNGDLDLRASRMPLAFRCAGSVRRPSLPVDETSDAAALGTAVHEALRPLAEGAGLQWDSLPAIAAQGGVDPDELRMLAATAAKLWPHVEQSFRGALTEVEITVEVAPGVHLSGHVDLLAASAGVARAGDWKSGRKDSDYASQMRAYGALVLLDDLTLTEVTVTILWIRAGEIENYTMTRDDAEAWVKDLLARVVEWDGVYRAGLHCGHCPRSHECEAATALVRRDVTAILATDDAEAALQRMTSNEILALHRKASLVLLYAGRVHDAIKAHVETHGDIDGTDTRLTLDVEKRRKLDTLAAWPVLEEAGFTDADFASCVDVSVSKVEKRIAQKAGRGKGAGAVRLLAEKLSTAGAVRTNEVQKLVEKRKAG